jgi:multiple sugar transport system substrate-binding protein
MPDITTAYPRTAIQFQSQGLLANLDAYFSSEELSAYIPAFLDEGRFGDGGLYVFPFAKSTELLFVNQTLFDRFAAATGVTMDCFNTFEGIADAAVKYCEWTGGKHFYTSDSWINLAQAGMLQQGASLFEGESLALSGAAYKHIWDVCYTPSVNGGFALYDGYSSDLSKTGDIVCSTGSSAGILFYGDSITYPDGTVEPVSYSILPFPVVEGGKKVAIQRGNGMMVAKTDETRETAAAIFIKWFTQPEQNIRFVAETGYLPVTQEAFETQMPQRLQTVENPYIRQMLETVVRMQADYDFFVPPSFEAFDLISRGYEQGYKQLLDRARSDNLAAGSPQPAASVDVLTEFAKEMQP